MNFQVPQFIEVEDKIFGPLTFKQFLWVGGGAGFGYIFYSLKFIPLVIRLVPTLLCVILGLALAFYKVNNRPLIVTIQAAIKYYLTNRLYLWKKEEKKPGAAAKKVEAKGPQIAVPRLSESRLRDITWSLDINEKVK